MKKTFEEMYPQGDPESVICRICGETRTRLSSGAIVCYSCDFVDSPPLQSAPL